VVQLLPHLAPVGAARSGLIARPNRACGRLRPGRTLQSLFIDATAPCRAKYVAESHRPCHLAEVPLAETGFAVRLTVDPRCETLLVIDVSELEPCRSSANGRDQGNR
jgi:hypothetical protein